MSPRPGSGSNSTVPKVNGSLLHNRDPIYNYHRKEKRRVGRFFYLIYWFFHKKYLQESTLLGETLTPYFLRCDICSVWVLSYRSMFCVFSMICARISCSDMRDDMRISCSDMRDDMRSGAWYAHLEMTCIFEYFSSIIEYFSSKVLSVDDLCL